MLGRSSVAARFFLVLSVIPDKRISVLFCCEAVSWPRTALAGEGQSIREALGSQRSRDLPWAADWCMKHGIGPSDGVGGAKQRRRLVRNVA